MSTWKPNTPDKRTRDLERQLEEVREMIYQQPQYFGGVNSMDVSASGRFSSQRATGISSGLIAWSPMTHTIHTTDQITLLSASVIVDGVGVTLNLQTINGTVNNGQLILLKPKAGKTLVLKPGDNINIGADVTVVSGTEVFLQYQEDDGNKYNMVGGVSGSSSGVTEGQNPVTWTGVHIFNGSAFLVNSPIITLGNAISDDIFIGGRFSDDLVPSAHNTYSLGTGSFYWKDHYIGMLHFNSLGSVTVAADPVMGYNNTNGVFINMPSTRRRITIYDQGASYLTFQPTSIEPVTNDLITLGNSGSRFKNLFLSGSIHMQGNLTVLGTSFLNGTTSQVGLLNMFNGMSKAVTTTTNGMFLNTTHSVLYSTNTSGTHIVNLPPASTSGGRVYEFYKKSAGGSTIVWTDGSDLINASATNTLSSQYASLRIISDGINRWMVI